MGSFDHYREAAEIAQHLDAIGERPAADAIRQAVSSGSTGTEIFMKLRHALTPLKREKLPDLLAARVRRLWSKLDAALRVQ